MFNRWKFIRRYATFRYRASFLPDNVKEKKRRKYYNIELRIYFSFNAKIRETVTSNGVNRKVNIKLHSRIYQRSRIYIYLLPHASLSLSLSLLFSQWRQVRSARVPSFYQRNKKCVRTFRKDAFRKWKTWKKNKNNDGNKNEINRGNKERRAERERRMEANSGLHAAKSFIPTLSFDSRSSYFVIISRV